MLSSWLRFYLPILRSLSLLCCNFFRRNVIFINMQFVMLFNYWHSRNNDIDMLSERLNASVPSVFLYTRILIFLWENLNSHLYLSSSSRGHESMVESWMPNLVISLFILFVLVFVFCVPKETSVGCLYMADATYSG